MRVRYRKYRRRYSERKISLGNNKKTPKEKPSVEPFSQIERGASPQSRGLQPIADLYAKWQAGKVKKMSWDKATTIINAYEKGNDCIINNSFERAAGGCQQSESWSKTLGCSTERTGRKGESVDRLHTGRPPGFVKTGN